MGETSTAQGAGAAHSVWLEWGASFGIFGGAAILAMVAVIGAVLLWRFERVRPNRTRATLVGLRVLALVLIVFLLLRPILVRTVSDPANAVVAVLFDDSASMTIRDSGGKARSERMLAALESDGRAFDRALDEQFHRAVYRVGAVARPLAAQDHLRFTDTTTDLPGALLGAAEDSRGLSLAAMVLFSDGAQSTDSAAVDWAAIEALGVPIYPVGVGESAWRDLALNDVSLSRSFLDDAPATIGAQVDAAGFDGETLIVEVLDDGQVVAEEEREIAGGDRAMQLRMEVPLRDRDWQPFDVRVRLKDPGVDDPEFIARNNQRTVLYDNREKSWRVLYFGGEPNWQHKFMLRAMEGDPDVQFSSLVRVSGAETKFVFRGRDSSLGNPLFEGFKGERDLPRYDEAVFLRLGLGPEELVAGYPSKAEDLYPFDLIIWGGIKPDFLATPQLALTRDAVAERGASFLMLAGDDTVLGSLADSVMAPLLPTMPPAATASGESLPARVAPQPEAFLTGVWALNADSRAHEMAWEALPDLPDVKLPGPARIGATVLARSEVDGSGESVPFFAWQSYGKGTGALLATGETWPWHMQTEAGNEAHERLWRQLVRSLVRNVPEATAMAVEPGAPTVGGEAALVWTVRDKNFETIEGASLQVTVTDAAGSASTVPGLEVLDTPGVYRAEFTPATAGLHQVHLAGEDSAGEGLAESEAAFLAMDDNREWRAPRFDEAFLKELATRSGGTYFALDQLQQLPPALEARNASELRQERHPIWHEPYFYGTLVLLMASEWALRRRAGQP